MTNETKEDFLKLCELLSGQATPRVSLCPSCGATTVPVVYGYPTEETLAEAGRGEVRLGGCCIRGESRPSNWCPACQRKF